MSHERDSYEVAAEPLEIHLVMARGWTNGNVTAVREGLRAAASVVLREKYGKPTPSFRISEGAGPAGRTQVGQMLQPEPLLCIVALRWQRGSIEIGVAPQGASLALGSNLRWFGTTESPEQ